jgi:heme exporter protein C
MKVDATQVRGQVRRGLVITGLAMLGVGVVVLLALRYTPVEVRQGLAQKIFYIHAPSAWCALLAISLTGLASLLYLWLSDPRLDRFAASSAEVGLVFGAVVLTTGPIWGKPIWGTWWTWDARLSSTLFLFFLMLGYQVLRSAIRDPGERARLSAVVGIMGLVLVPFVHLSVYMFTTLHPMPIVLKPSAPSLDPEMFRTLLISFAVFTLLYIGLVTLVYGLRLARDIEEASHG